MSTSVADIVSDIKTELEAQWNVGTDGIAKPTIAIKSKNHDVNSPNYVLLAEGIGNLTPITLKGDDHEETLPFVIECYHTSRANVKLLLKAVKRIILAKTGVEWDIDGNFYFDETHDIVKGYMFGRGYHYPSATEI